jgi:hypothetical protein
MTINGMVRVAGVTYRIRHTQTGVYEVTRILDDAPAGSFVLGPPMQLMPGVVDANELYLVARSAVQNALTG